MTVPGSFGRYRVVEELGRGAMGVVYRGVDPALDRTVAIKAISARQPGSSVQGQELETRFLREAKLSARISHPGVVTVFDAGREGSNLYLVMELVEGESLADRLARGQYPTAREAFEIAASVADALSAAHQLGVVHRDIKPANILLTREGRVKVSDFGVAKAIGEGTDLTRTGMVVGSPAYMAPEQVRGEAVDGRADLFSLGVILYELLLRRRPFPADTLTTLIFQILHEDPFADAATFSSLGEDAAAFLRTCLAKDLRERVPDAVTFAARARELAARASAPAQPSPAATATRTVMPAATMAKTATTSPMAAAEDEGVTKPFAVEKPAPAEPAKRGRAVGLVAILGLVLLAIAVGIVAFRRPAARTVAATTAEPTAEPAANPTIGPTALSPLAGDATAVATPESVATPSRSVRTAAPLAPSPQSQVGNLESVALAPLPTPTPPVEEVFTCSKGADFNVSPEDAVVTINGKTIGIADDWDNKGGGKTFFFSAPGFYYVRFTLEGYKTTWIKIVVEPTAKDEIADIDTELAEEK